VRDVFGNVRTGMDLEKEMQNCWYRFGARFFPCSSETLVTSLVVFRAVLWARNHTRTSGIEL
jgi:hypothetical protein